MVEENLLLLCQNARDAFHRNDWISLLTISNRIINDYKHESEGYYFSGIANKGLRKYDLAIKSFIRALEINDKRFDAAIELADIYLIFLRYTDSFEVLDRYIRLISNNPYYFHLSGKIYTGLGLHDKALPLFEKANQLQPNQDVIRGDLAKCLILNGRSREAKKIFLDFLFRFPDHQRFHYEISKLEKANDYGHIDQMKKILEANNSSPEKNIFLFYALGKELEDLECWTESFKYYEKAGNAVLSTINYDVNDDIDVINKIIETCSENWVNSRFTNEIMASSNKTPIFIVGLPRTGTTLVDRIISSHSMIESVDETFFMQLSIRYVAEFGGIGDVDQQIIEKAAQKDISLINKKYFETIEYRLDQAPMFVDKYPLNFLYLGFIAKAFPNAKIIYLRRNPMDACLALFKQSYFKFAYSLEDLGKYYIAQEKMRNHWRNILKDKIIELDYEKLVADQENTTRLLLEKLGVEFESQCLNFEKNPNPSATASTVQVRSKIHSSSVNKWKFFEKELDSLKKFFINSGISIE
ncbi:MAG: sulfotransferase [Gammaproteobacteria bacterium]|nr:sulfotransferase [Gammaproteobacteria bacterium]MDH5629395.1 sulfotransferase [Gammaproteobacteria bacterium]